MERQENRQANLTVVPYLGPQYPGRRGRRRRVSNGDESQRDPNSLKHLPKIRTACDACRVKKTRCSGHMPCVRCSRHGQTCTYMPNLSPTHYPPTGEAIPAIITHDTAPPPSAANPVPGLPPNLPVGLVQAGSTASPDSAGLCGSLDAHALPEYSINESCDENGDDNDESPSAPLQQDQYGHVHGGSSVFAFLNFAKQRLASLPSMSIEFSDYPLASLNTLPRVLPPKEIADQLVQTYFEIGLNTSRFVHEPTFRESYEKLHSSGPGLPQDTLVLIYMVLAVGSHYSKPDSMWSGYSASVQYYEMAESQFQRLPSRITLTSLQARLVLVHYLLNHSRMHEAWSSFGTVVRHAQALGLHCRSRRPPSSHIIHEFRKRVFWVIYINDRILASIFGRPCAINDDDVDQEECVMSNDIDITHSASVPTETGMLCAAAALIHYAQLARILGKILRQFYSLTTRRQTMSHLHKVATEFEAELARWQSTLPEYLNFVTIPSFAVTIALHRQLSTLKLTFAYANLLLYRPFMFHSIGISAKSTSNVEFEQWVKRCHDQSIAAARMIVSECQSLQARGLFSKVFWMVNYAQFAAIGTLYMYYYFWPEAEYAWNIAEEARLQFPVGVEDDPVGQRYIEVLSELSQFASSRTGANINLGLPEMTEVDGENDDTLGMDISTLDFGGPWSNLFFDPNMFVDYVGRQVSW